MANRTTRRGTGPAQQYPLRVPVRATAAQVERWTAAAERVGISLAAWMRLAADAQATGPIDIRCAQCGDTDGPHGLRGGRLLCETCLVE